MNDLEIMEKAVKYDLIMNILLSCYGFNSWDNEACLYSTERIDSTIEALEPERLRERKKKVKDNWIKENEELAKEKGIAD